MTAKQDIPALRTGIWGTKLMGLAGLALLFGVFGIWAVTTQIGGAVIARGSAVVEGKPKVVQSRDGGEVEEILVQDGDTVAAGDLLMRFDSTLAKTNLDISRRRLAGALARQARLRAENDALPAPVFEYDDLPFTLPDLSGEEADQRTIFEVRRQRQQDIAAQLERKLASLQSQMSGVEGKIAALQAQVDSLDEDIAVLEPLRKLELTPRSEITRLQRQRADAEGDLIQAQSQLESLRNSLDEAQLTFRQDRNAYREEVATELRETTAKIDELVLEIVELAETLDRNELHAPVAGTVHAMQFTTLGAVIAPGEEILRVIPTDRGVEFQLKLDPADVDRVYQGQDAELVLSALGPDASKRLAGRVTRVSADVLTEPRSGAEYYEVGLEVLPIDAGHLDAVALVPGMPVEAYLKTGERSVMAYLMAPISSHLRRAFREDTGS